ncbi:unnamed protein product [Clonostachys solani]|uniref:Uncharacterized protein n=1 Tax=Clonostachys solani TaxID=160281 RepID=A0A9N9Z934_9HYPO|nr:unnamed protein product [Clonostachys solani]
MSQLHHGRTMKDWGSALPTRTLHPHDDLKFAAYLKPKDHVIQSTPEHQRVLFRDVNILDSTGAQPFRGDVLVEGERIKYVGTVPGIEKLQNDSTVTVIHGKGRTLMSGLGDAHTHFTWNESALDNLGQIGVEEHTLTTARSAATYLDAGYTMCFGAASAKSRLDVVIRDGINQGLLAGPRYLANGMEIARRGGELTAGITAFADGPREMREVIRSHAKIGVDQIKLSMSGEEILDERAARDSYFTEEETAACVEEAHRHGLRVCSHARSQDSVRQCIKYGLDVIYHASYIDKETMDELEKNKHLHVVAPGLNWLYATIHEAGPFGYSFDQAEKAGYKEELDTAIRACKEMHQRGITVLPGGDYGFAWTPHGTYARDLEHFVKLLDFTPMESIISATAGVAKLFMREHELGKVLPGYYADLILVDGQPLDNIKVLQDHSKLVSIMINGRLHKNAAGNELVQAKGPKAVSGGDRLTNFVSYVANNEKPRIGHLDLEKSTITPLAMISGAPITNLYQVIELENAVKADGDSIPLSGVTLQAPIKDRDILAVGKNYAEHAAEFNRSGYDSSDKVDQPTHPVIFTKRATSIIASGEKILPHPDFTSSLDYEGEIGVIIGKSGYQISESNAMDHVWGYTIINDMTARERQRDHKQFYIGKSSDTFCPMGPLAVPAGDLPEHLQIQTFVNGEKRQDSSTRSLIFSVSTLVKTMSESITLRPGDVLATGTPAGVGLGFKPEKFLKPGDKIEVSVAGLGTLTNTIGDFGMQNPVPKAVDLESHLANLNLENTVGGQGLMLIGNKYINVRKIGDGHETAVFVHGLGGTAEFFTPIVEVEEFKSRFTSFVYDLEGHGLSATEIAANVRIESLTDDLQHVIEHIGTSGPITLVAHSLGCLIASTYALRQPGKINKLILLGPVTTPLGDPGRAAITQRARDVRSKGMLASGTACTVADAGTSDFTKRYSPVAFAATRASLLATSPEGYAKACLALVNAPAIPFEKIKCPTLVVTGDEDKTAPVAAVSKIRERLPNSGLEILRNTGHWHVYESPEVVYRAIYSF